MKYDLRVAARTQAGLGPYSDIHPGYTDVEGKKLPTWNILIGPWCTANMFTSINYCAQQKYSQKSFLGHVLK